MRKAISAAKTKLLLENLDAPADATGLLRSVSKSQPATAIFDDVSKLRNGAAVYIIGTGFASIDGRSWVVQDIDINTRAARLANTDTSRETEAFNPNGAWVLHAYTDLCVVSYSTTAAAAAEIDVTTLCDEEKSFLVGFSDPGTLTFDFFVNPIDPDYQALREAQKDGRERMLEIVYRNGAVRTLPVIVQSINESGGVDQAIQGSATLKIAGADVLTMPPGEQVLDYVLIPIVAPSTGNVPLAVTLTLNEAGGAATKFEIDWRDGTALQSTTLHQASHTYTAAGQYQPSIVATVAGAETAPFRSQNIVTVQRLPYSVVANVQPISGEAPLQVTLSVVETNGPAETFEVDWNDGTSVQVVSAANMPVSRIYDEAGIYTITVVPILDGVRQTPVTPSSTVNVSGNYQLTAQANPTTGNAPLAVTLTLSQSGGIASSFDINWGDGEGSFTEGATGLTHNHTYSEPGTFDIGISANVPGLAGSGFYISGPTVTVGSGA